MSHFFASGGQSIGASASASVLPMNIQGWFPLGLTDLISLLSKGLSKVFPTPQFKSINSLAFRGQELTPLHFSDQRVKPSSASGPNSVSFYWLEQHWAGGPCWGLLAILLISFLFTGCQVPPLEHESQLPCLSCSFQCPTLYLPHTGTQ